jgi:hypothetical protein
MKKALIQFTALFCSITLWAQEEPITPTLQAYVQGEGIQLEKRNGYSTLIRGYIQPYFEAKDYTEAGNEELLNRFRMRRMRVRVQGESEPLKLGYRMQFDLSGASEFDEELNYYLLDAFIFYKPTKRITIELGQRTTPTDNRGLRINSHTLQLVERSRVTSAFSSLREVGLFAQGRFRAGSSGAYWRPYLAITTGDGGNLFQTNHGGFKYGGRIDYLPFGLFTNFGQFREVDMVREPGPKLVIGGHYSYNQGMSSRRGRESGAIIYLNEDQNESLPDYWKMGIDLMLKWRGFSALAEFVHADASVPEDIAYRVRNDGSVASTFLVDGIQDVENYIKGRMMIGNGYNVQMGYLFKSGFSVDGRYCHLDAPEHSFLNNGTFYNRPNYYTLGLSKYFNRNYGFSIKSSLTFVELNEGSNDINSNPITGNEWIFRLMTTFAF